MNGVQDFSVRAAELWRDIVNFALDTPEDRLEQLATTLAGAWTESKASLLRKLKAVRTAAASGLDRQGICKLGQSEALSLHARANRKNREKMRVVSFRVPASLAEAFVSEDASPDAEEALVSRLARVCELRTSEDLLEFLLSVFADISDKDLKNLAGVNDLKKRRS